MGEMRLVLPAVLTLTVPPFSSILLHPHRQKKNGRSTANIRTLSPDSVVLNSSTSLHSSGHNSLQLVPVPCDDRRHRNGDELDVVEGGGGEYESGNSRVSGIVTSSSQLVRREYAQLNLKQDCGSGHVRIRQHVNPLSTSLSIPAQVPEWNEVFKDPTLPLMVDIGCGGGRFLLWLANMSHGSNNYLGLEIRRKLVTRAELWAKELELKNIYFMFANATNSFEPLVASYPGPLMLVSLLCPDPYFKNRHRKRRTLQKPLLDSIAKNLSPWGKVFIQSDVYDVVLEIREQFDALSGVFAHVDAVDPKIICDSEGWVLSNPMGIRTEREIHAEFEGAKIFRRLYIKRGHTLSTS